MMRTTLKIESVRRWMKWWLMFYVPQSVELGNIVESLEGVDVVEMTKEVVEATKPFIEVESFETLEAREKVEDIVELVEMLEGGEVDDLVQVVPNCAQNFDF